MSESARQHQADAPRTLVCAVVTISDTRTIDSDTGGPAIVTYLESAGHRVANREIIRDEPEQVRSILSACTSRDDIDAILMTGGTGISHRDQTFETLSQLLTKPLPGYGEIFRWLSYQEIGPAAMLSRAQGGLIGRVVVLTMPGSPAGVRLAMERLILPELGHLVRQARH